MSTVTCTHQGCDRKFTKPNQRLAELALGMHIGRVHNGNIKRHTRHNGLTAIKVEKTSKGRLSSEQRKSLITFIQDKHTEFPNMVTCVRAGLKANGLEGIIKPTSTAVAYYFKQASANGKPMARRYRKDTVDKVLRHYADMEQETTSLRCPSCSFDLNSLRLSRVAVKYCPGCGTPIATFIRQLTALLSL